MMTEPQSLVLLALIFCSASLAFGMVIGAGKEVNRRRQHANHHEKIKAQNDTPEVLLAKMRHDRGLDREGYINNLNYRIGRMVTQSGLPLKSNMIYFLMLVSSGLIGIAVLLWKQSTTWMAGGAIIGFFLPIVIVEICVRRRRQKAARQLPDALDVIIRSLKAGHPVPVALSLVGREMPDPIGTEFGMASDELSFGGSVSNAIQRMADRIGQDDFDLFAAMIRLQEKTGGNLAELLENNAATIRGRQRLRLKVRAASAEGRASAMILNAAPIALYVLVNLIAPDFYGEVEDSAVMDYVFIGIIIWMIIGNMVMRKMINFKV